MISDVEIFKQVAPRWVKNIVVQLTGNSFGTKLMLPIVDEIVENKIGSFVDLLADSEGNLHFNGEYSSVNKYDFNFIMNKKKAKDKYEGRSINELAYKSYESLTDDSFPYPEAKAYFIFLTYLYSTMAEKHKLFK